MIQVVFRPTVAAAALGWPTVAASAEASPVAADASLAAAASSSDPFVASFVSERKIIYFKLQPKQRNTCKLLIFTASGGI